MEVIILAGGLGTRLQTVVNDRPKALSMVAGKPFLSYVIDYLVTQKASHFIFSLGYLSEQVVSFLNDAYPAISRSISLETTPLGTGGAIKQALKYSKEEDVIVVNADTFFDVDLVAMYHLHKSAGADCTIALKHMYHFDRYGTIELDKDMRVVSFQEKCFREEGLINGGYLFIRKSCMLSRQLPGIFSFEKDFLEQELKNMLVKGFISGGYFIDIGIPSDYQKAQQDFLRYNKQS